MAVGKIGAALGEVCLVAVRKGADEAVGVDETGGRFDLRVAELRSELVEFAQTTDNLSLLEQLVIKIRYVDLGL